MANQGNFAFFGGREDPVYAGMRHNAVPVPWKGNVVIPSLVVGPSPRVERTRAPAWATIIPAKIGDAPRFRGEKIFEGSIIEEATTSGKTEHVMVAHHDDEANYVLVRTGLRVIDGSTANDWMALQGAGIELKSHGSYSFDKGSVKVAAADDEVIKDPNIKIGKVAAERIHSKAVGKRIPLLGCPQSSFVLWKMPFGSVLLVRDITGHLWRLLSTKSSVQKKDAKGYDSFFDQLQAAEREIGHRQRAQAVGAD